MSIYSTQHGLSKYVKIFERLYLIIRILAILSEMCTDFGLNTVCSYSEKNFFLN